MFWVVRFDMDYVNKKTGENGLTTCLASLCNILFPVSAFSLGCSSFCKSSMIGQRIW